MQESTEYSCVQQTLTQSFLCTDFVLRAVDSKEKATALVLRSLLIQDRLGYVSVMRTRMKKKETSSKTLASGGVTVLLPRVPD